jgi:hypothetical protein
MSAIGFSPHSPNELDQLREAKPCLLTEFYLFAGAVLGMGRKYNGGEQD